MIPLCLNTYRILLPVAESSPTYKVWSTLGGNLKKEKCTLQIEHQVSLHKSTGSGLQPLFTPLLNPGQRPATRISSGPPRHLLMICLWAQYPISRSQIRKSTKINQHASDLCALGRHLNFWFSMG